MHKRGPAVYYNSFTCRAQAPSNHQKLKTYNNVVNMKSIIIAIIGIIPFVVAQRCNADNCARRVTGTFRAAGVPDVTSRGSDCSSYMQTTVIPDTL